MTIQRVDIRQAEEVFPGSITEDYEHGAFSKRLALAVGRLAGISAQSSGGGFNLLLRNYTVWDENSGRTGVIRTSNFPGSHYPFYGRPQHAVTVDSFLATMYSICRGEQDNRLTPVRFDFLLTAASSMLLPDEPELIVQAGT